MEKKRVVMPVTKIRKLKGDSKTICNPVWDVVNLRSQQDTHTEVKTQE